MEYTKQEIKKTHRAYLCTILLLLAWILAGLILTCIFLFSLRNKALAILSCILCGAPAIFFWGMWGIDVLRYERFMHGISTGLHNRFNGTVTQLGQITVHDELPMQQIYILDEKQNLERLCYRDIFKEDPLLKNLRVGQKACFTIHAQAIIKIEEQA